MNIIPGFMVKKVLNDGICVCVNINCFQHPPINLK